MAVFLVQLGASGLVQVQMPQLRSYFSPLLPVYDESGLNICVLQQLEITFLSFQTILINQGIAHPSELRVFLMR